MLSRCSMAAANGTFMGRQFGSSEQGVCVAACCDSAH
jgi:hypothetical protein